MIEHLQLSPLLQAHKKRLVGGCLVHSHCQCLSEWLLYVLHRLHAHAKSVADHRARGHC